MTLSRSEVEYVAITEAVKETKFMYFLLRDVRIDLDLPVLMKIDNIGAKCLWRKMH
jgi:hypothetical protein